MTRALLALTGWIAVWGWMGQPALAQPIQVYSELAKLDGAGKVIAPEFPREILSPALVRNGYTSFQVVVSAADGTSWELYVAQNPDNATTVTLYRINGERLEPVPDGVRGSGTQVFWMDVWADARYPVSRIKLEPQLRIDNDWVIYPMEGRVMSARVPEGQGSSFPELCDAALGRQPPGSALGQTVPALRFRNAAQDRALAAAASPDELSRVLAGCPESDDPESYLRIRDFLFKRMGGA